MLLVHTLPDGSSHLDWLIERPHTPTPSEPEPPKHRMLTFRCQTDPLVADSGTWVGLQLPDHRAHYIDYEGPVSGNRGHVARLWCRPCTPIEITPTGLRLRLHQIKAPDTKAFDLTLTPGGDGHWTLDDRTESPEHEPPTDHADTDSD